MHERDWSSALPTPDDVIEGAGVHIHCRPPAGAVLVSGDLDQVLPRIAPGAPVLGLMGEVPLDGPAALRIARDRALLISAAPLGLAPGWQDGAAVTPADDAHVVFELRGPKLGGLLEATMAQPNTPSPSAAILFAGTHALVARQDRAALVWAARPESAGLWHALTGIVASL